jgi:predicted DCC family thiol-disulfide oxidoreductase YuxK
MNTKIIIYDDSCPLCSAYTSTFVKTGLIDKDSRKNFSTITPELLQQIDIKRAVNEIPVIDTATKQVWYGIDALLEILQQKIPFAKPIGNIRAIKWLLQKLYKFISYNRRVIVAAKTTPGYFDCPPDFNIRYRFTFMAIFLAVNTSLLFLLQQYVLAASIFSSTGTLQLQLAHASLVFINILIASQLNKKDGFEYLGQINMLALIVMLLTVPLILLNRYATVHNSQLNSFYLGIITLFAVQEYTRRMKFIGFVQSHPGIIFANVISAAAFTIYLIL